LVEPIVVRPHEDGYQILGGYHRWKIARELGCETVPCAVVDLDDRRAKILTINLNEMKGQSVSALLSELVHDLSQELTLEDLESQLPYSGTELKDALEIMKIPDGLEALLDEEVEKAERERPHILSFVVEDVETVEKAIEKASQAGGGITRGKALVEMARSYVDEVVPSE
jgi:ParB-like chromosome segregation protein Spo0J